MRTVTIHTILRPSWILSGTTWVSRHQKGKTNLDFLEQEIVSGSDISWAICKFAPWPRPASHHSIFTGRMPFLPPTNSVKALKACCHNHYCNKSNGYVNYELSGWPTMCSNAGLKLIFNIDAPHLLQGCMSWRSVLALLGTCTRRTTKSSSLCQSSARNMAMQQSSCHCWSTYVSSPPYWMFCTQRAHATSSFC